MNEKRDQPKAPTIAELYPSLTEEECKEAEANFRIYIEIVLRVYERIRHDPAEIERLHALTESHVRLKIERERSRLQDTNQEHT